MCCVVEPLVSTVSQDNNVPAEHVLDNGFWKDNLPDLVLFLSFWITGQPTVSMLIRDMDCCWFTRLSPVIDSKEHFAAYCICLVLD